MLLVVWIAVPVLALLVLAGLAYGLLGALQRLGRELSALDRDLRPLLAQAQATAARAADRGERRADTRRPPDRRPSPA